MPLRPSKTYARFNVGSYLKEIKQQRDCLATTNQSIENKKQEVIAAQQKLKRLESKVCTEICQINKSHNCN